MAKRENLKREEIVLLVNIEKRTPTQKGTNSIYMDMGSVDFETDLFIGECHVAPMGGTGPVVTIRRKKEDEMAYRHYSLKAKDFIQAVVECESAEKPK